MSQEDFDDDDDFGLGALLEDEDLFKPKSGKGHKIGTEDSDADLAKENLELIALKKQLEIDPKNVDLLIKGANLLRGTKKIDDAIDYIDRALEANPNHAEALNMKGQLLVDLNSASEAIHYFTKAIYANPQLEAAWLNKAIVLEQEGAVNEALYNLDMVLKINPDNAKARNLRSLILEIEVRPKRAWLFVGTEETWNEKFKIGGSWGMHENALDIESFLNVGKGDLIIAFKRKPVNMIFAVMEVRTPIYTDFSTMWRHRIDIEPRIRLKKPISLNVLKRSPQLVEIWNFIRNPDTKRTVFEIEPESWELLKELIFSYNSDLKKDALEMEIRSKDMAMIYDMDINAITNKVFVPPRVLNEIQTHLKSGRNIILYGPPGSGKEQLAQLIAEQICGKRFKSEGHDFTNFTAQMANPLWNDEDIMGFWENQGDKTVFRKGFGIQAIELCEDSIRNSNRPHYLIINKMNKLDLDRAFNRFLNVVGEKDTSVALSLHRGETLTLRVPKEFRIIGTADSDEWSIPENLLPLRGQFSFIEVSVPEKSLEYEEIPFLVRERLVYLGTLNQDDLLKQEFKGAEITMSRFDNDPDGEIQKAYDKLIEFVSKDKYPPKGTVLPRGIRTYRAIGTRLLVETMLCVANAPYRISKEKALEDAIMSIFLPILEKMEAAELYNIELKAKEVFGLRSNVVDMITALISMQKGPGELEDEDGMKVDDWTDEDEDEDAYISNKDVEAVEINYDIDLTPIFDHLSISKKTLDQILVNLESGRNIILYGAPGCGKTKVATLLLALICGKMTLKNGQQRPNFTIVTANAEWDNYDIVGGVAPKVDEYTKEISYEFRDGCVTQAVKDCLRSLKRIGRPHHLIIDEFNRANIDEAFGKLFTIFEYRDTQALLTSEENRGDALYLPRQFRVIGTMNVQDKNTLFDIGHALMRRFAFIEVGLPDKEDEFSRMPHFVELRAKEMGIILKGDKTEKSLFRGDPEGKADAEYRKLMKFLEEDPMPEEGIETSVGVRTYRKIGTAQVIDCVIWCLKAGGDYSKEDAMQDAIVANILPQLENLEKAQISNMYIRAVEVFTERSKVARALDRMLKSTTLSVFS
ncbi:MAG: EVE domain-containing protein [Thermoplasmata archaeon]|nr:MAG: EVE domain-containing protein [Thermoplasmata archaeon]